MIRRLLETRKNRERILMAAFLWAFVLLWAVLAAGAMRKNVTALRLARSEIRDQKSMLAQKGDIETRLEKARTSIDTAKTLDALKLSGVVDSIARDSGITANIASPVSRNSDIFNTNSVRVSCKKATLEQLLNFTQSIRKQAPYLAIRRFKISADQRDPHNLGAEVEIESFELNKKLSR
jgi:hypothetical protein